MLQRRILAEPKKEFVWDTVVEGIEGEQSVNALKLRNVKTNEISSLPVSGIFVAVGLRSNTGPFKDIVDVDKNGQIIVDESMQTSVQGIYAAGDIRAHSARQVSTAVGDGATAAMAAFKYIKEK